MDLPNTFYKSAHMLFVTVNLEVDTSMGPSPNVRENDVDSAVLCFR